MLEQLDTYFLLYLAPTPTLLLCLHLFSLLLKLTLWSLFVTVYLFFLCFFGGLGGWRCFPLPYLAPPPPPHTHIFGLILGGFHAAQPPPPPPLPSHHAEVMQHRFCTISFECQQQLQVQLKCSDRTRNFLWRSWRGTLQVKGSKMCISRSFNLHVIF